MMLHKNKGVDVVPSLYYASKMLNEEYSPNIIEHITVNRKSTTRLIDRYSLVAEEFESELCAMLDELFDPSKPFKQIEDLNTCSKCDYKEICRRQNAPRY